MKLTFETEPNSKIDVNYSYYLASAIYRSIERVDPELSIELHKPNVPKFFTFSKLMIPKKRVEGDNIVIESEEVYLFFSSLRERIAEKLVEGLFMKPEIEIKGLKLTLSKVEVLEEKKIGCREKFINLSPIYVSKLKDGKVLDLYPTQIEFYEVLRKNLVRKYEYFYGEKLEDDDVEIEVLSFKPKRIRIKDTWHRCVEMVFEAKGNPILLEIGYKAGFGSKNSMGFGMVKVL